MYEKKIPENPHYGTIVACIATTIHTRDLLPAQPHLAARGNFTTSPVSIVKKESRKNIHRHS